MNIFWVILISYLTIGICVALWVIWLDWSIPPRFAPNWFTVIMYLVVVLAWPAILPLIKK